MKQEIYDKAKHLVFQTYLLESCLYQWENKLLNPKDLNNISKDETNMIPLPIFEKFISELIFDLKNRIKEMNGEFDKL